MRKLKYVILAAMLACAVPIAQGCASQHQETTVERTSTTTDKPVPIDSEAAQTPAEQTTTTTTTTTTKSPDEPPSVLGATASAVGTIILFPFRLAGDALSLLL